MVVATGPARAGEIALFKNPLSAVAVNGDAEPVGTLALVRMDADAAIKQAGPAAQDDTQYIGLENTGTTALFTIAIPVPRKVIISGSLMVRVKTQDTSTTNVGGATARTNCILAASNNIAEQTANGQTRTVAGESVIDLFHFTFTDATIDDGETLTLTIEYEVVAGGNAADVVNVKIHIDPATSGNELLLEWMVESD